MAANWIAYDDAETVVLVIAVLSVLESMLGARVKYFDTSRLTLGKASSVADVCIVQRALKMASTYMVSHGLCVFTQP